MAKIQIKKETTTPPTPDAGFITLYPEGTSMKYIDETATVRTLASGITREEVEDILANSFADTATITWVYNDGSNQFEASIEASTLATINSALQASDIVDFETTTELNARDVNNRSRVNHTGSQTASTISDFDTEVDNNSSVVANTAKKSNEYHKHVKSSSFTLDIDTESMVLCVGQTAAMTITVPLSNTFPVGDVAREFGILNFGDHPVTVVLSGTNIFTSGISSITLQKGGIVRFLGAYPTLPAPHIFVISQLSAAITQARRDATWSASNFTSATAVPFDTTDLQTDLLRIERNLSNTTRVDIKASGNHTVDFSCAIDSTGGSGYKVDFYLRVNGTTTIPGSTGSVGNYQFEDSYFSKTIAYNFTAGDYIELILDQVSSLTGNANNIVMKVRES
jgi:hypothetical protein